MVLNANESHVVQILVWSNCSCCSRTDELVFTKLVCLAPSGFGVLLPSARLWEAFFGLLVCSTARTAGGKVRQQV